MSLTSREDYWNINDIIENASSKRFSIIIISLVSIVWFAVGPFFPMSAQISPYLQCEWKLTTLQISWLSTAFFVDLSVGSLLGGYASDSFGRKTALVFGLIMASYYTVLGANSPSMTWYFLMRFFNGFGCATLVNISTVLVTEYVKVEERGLALMILNLAGQVSYVVFIAIAYFILNRYGWRIYLTISSIWVLLAFPFLTQLPESIRYLQNTGDRNAIMKILNRIASINRTPLPKKIKFECKTSEIRASFQYLLQNYGVKVLAMSWLWVVIMIPYYGISFLIEVNLIHENKLCKKQPTHYENKTTTEISQCNKFTDNQILQNLFTSLGSLPGPVICYFLMESCYILTIFCWSKLVNLLILFTNFAFSSGSSTFIFLYTSESFPTVVRAAGLGLASSIGNIASVGVPFMFQYFVEVWYVESMTVMSIFCISGAFALCFLEETRGKQLMNE